MPSICLYKIEEIRNKQKNNLYNKQPALSAEPAFRINGAEMFLESDAKEKNTKI